MPIGDYPILEVIVRQLPSRGFRHITLAVNHQAELTKSFFRDGSKWGIKIDYSRRPTSYLYGNQENLPINERSHLIAYNPHLFKNIK